MAIITPQFLKNLNTAVLKTFSSKYEEMRAQTFWGDVATMIPSTTASNTYSWLNDFPELIEWIGTRTVKDMAVSGYEIANRLFEATVGIQRTDIEDDQFGHYTLRTSHMAQKAAEHPDRIIADVMRAGTASLCYDGQNFFDIDHPVYPNVDGTGVPTTWSNYEDGGAAPEAGWFLLDTRGILKPFIFQERTRPELESQVDPSKSDNVFMTDQYRYGIRYRCNGGYGFPQQAFFSKQPLNEANFDAAMARMMSLEADGGRPLGIMPNLLVVPPTLRAKANAVIEVMQGEGGKSNPNYKAVETKVVPWLAGV